MNLKTVCGFLANHEEKNELLDLGLTSKARYVKRVLELGKVYAHV